MFYLGVHVSREYTDDEIAALARFGYRPADTRTVDTIHIARSKDRAKLVKVASKAIRDYAGPGDAWYEITEG